MFTRSGLDSASALEVLHIVNKNQCKPPLPADEVDKIKLYENATEDDSIYSRQTPFLYDENKSNEDTSHEATVRRNLGEMDTDGVDYSAPPTDEERARFIDGLE
jgi:hypothetical protein